MQTVKRREWIFSAILILFIVQVVLLPVMIGLTYATRSERPEHILTYTTGSLIWDKDTAVRPDGSPSPMLNDRVTRGAQLYQAGWAKKVLLTGDNSSSHYNEVAVMDRLSQEQGVPAEDTVLDYAGLCTYDSLYRARDIFGVKKLVIVTQEYHLYRALYLAKALGLEAWGVAADGQNYRGQTMRDLREILARDKDVLWSFFQPEPKYLGDPIPLDTAD